MSCNVIVSIGKGTHFPYDTEWVRLLTKLFFYSLMSFSLAPASQIQY